MGVVYKARQVGLNRLVALKMILAGPHAGEDDLARFCLEAEAAARLEHPNLVHIYEVGEHEGHPYFSLEFVDGGNLHDRLDGQPQPPRLAARLVETLALAMQAAHERGIVHRDLKPANVLLAGGSNVPLDQCVPKITDFGLAKRLDSNVIRTQSGDVLGTPSYMAPEQAAGKAREVGPAADIWALGAILYELLTGRPPFLADTPWDTIAQVIADDPVPPRRLQPKVPRDLETICLKCLQKEPAQRYPTARALAEDLRRFLSNEPIRARPIGIGERAMKWVKRRPAAAALIAVCLLAVLVLIGSGLVYHARLQAAFRRAEEKAEENRQLLVRLHVARGTRLADEGNLFGALIWLAEALRLENGDPPQEEVHRVRLAAVLRQCPRLTRLWLHQGPVHHVAVSPDGRYAVTAGDRTARVWDLATGEPAGLAFVHDGPVFQAAFSADGRRVVTAGGDHTARVWDFATGKPLLAPLRHDGPVTGASFSPDGRQILTISDENRARLWDAANGDLLGPPLRHQGMVKHAVFSADGRYVATASADHTARVWDALTRQPITPPLRHEGPVNHVDFRPDGRQLVTSSADGTARVWDVARAETVGAPLRHGDAVSRAVFSPDGKRVLTASEDDMARLWDAASGELLVPPLRHGSDVRQAAFSIDGQRIVTCSDDNTARVWDAASGEPLSPPLLHHGTVQHAVITPDSRRVLTASDDTTARAWDLATRPLLVGRSEPVPPEPSAAVSADGRRVVKCVGSTAVVCDATTGEPVGPPLRHGSAVRQAVFSPEGRRVLTVSGDNTARVWDAASGTLLLPPLRHQGTVEHGTFSPDGRWIATASKDHTARVWDAHTGEPVCTLRHRHAVRLVSFAPDGRRLLTVAGEPAAFVWEIPIDERPTADLVLLAQLLSGSKMDASDGLRPLEPEALYGAWQALRSEYPDDFVPPSHPSPPVGR
jgi:WD40 repeat protein